MARKEGTGGGLLGFQGLDLEVFDLLEPKASEKV